MNRVAYATQAASPLQLGEKTREELGEMLQARPKVLIADDSATNRLVVKRLLADFEADLVESSTGVEVLAAAREHDFALILLDVEMPELDGFEAIRHLRENPRAAATPVIMISARMTAEEHRKLGYELGAVDYLVDKPVNPEMLRRKVRVFLDLYQKRVEFQQAAARAQHENERLYQENEQFRATRNELVHLATHDALTGLPNRVLFEDRLESAIQRNSRSNSHFALVYFDLDRFKNVNDRYGHAAGDHLLSTVSQRMVGALRGSDTVARLSGDEFVMLIEGIDGAPRAELIARKVLQVLRQPVDVPTTHSPVGRAMLEPSASVGIAMYPTDAKDADGLLMLADLAMYRVKQSGGNDVRLYLEGASGEAPAAPNLRDPERS